VTFSADFQIAIEPIGGILPGRQTAFRRRNLADAAWV